MLNTLKILKETDKEIGNKNIENYNMKEAELSENIEGKHFHTQKLKEIIIIDSIARK
ncbi:hypothetical protein [Tepidimicrobium xylanilyticum]|uniref:hypothetical protein n=1 Tax=Tepidimicrobium xylanilyticum TaxID=1123352 RepID=UPI002653C02D|nr:hypothetical protein [Tepidimicrobium xylanilyticum]GMG95988.1 hypothetical protein EN5CB1_08140 [Tepidimicrobium xylanilyticum]